MNTLNSTPDGKFRRVLRTDASDRGWLDYRRGLPYPKEYDSWAKKDQRNYENGRLRAATHALAFPHDVLPLKQPSRKVQIEAIRAVGHWAPDVSYRRWFKFDIPVVARVDQRSIGI